MMGTVRIWIVSGALASVSFFAVPSLFAADTLTTKDFPYVLETPDTIQVRVFKEAFASALEKMGEDPKKSIAILLKIGAREKLAEIYRIYLLSRAYEKDHQFQRADSLLEDALAWIRPSEWRTFFSAKRFKFTAFLPQGAVKKSFYLEQLKEGHGDSIQISLLIELLKYDNFSGAPGPGDDHLRRLLGLDPWDNRVDSIYAMAAEKSSPGQRSAEVELALAKYENYRGRRDLAIKRCFAIPRLTAKKSVLADMRLFHPGIHYRKGDYNKAIHFYKRYLSLYGNHATVILQIARAYKKLGQMDTSTYWYDVFSKRFPSHRKTEEIFWSRGWDAEEAKKWEEALGWYQKLLPKFEDGRKGPWANFRMGYCLYKAGRLAEALEHFIRGTEQNIGYLSIPASLFWAGKTHHALGQALQAAEHFNKLVRDYPLSYYSHFARSYEPASAMLKDSSSKFTLSKIPEDSTEAWIRDNFSQYKPERNFGNSAYLSVSELMEWGLKPLAYLTFETSYRKHRDNPWFLYHYAREFSKNWESKSYQLARKLGYQIPNEKLKDVPRHVMKMMYPRYFREFVKKNATAAGIPENFVYALIKQESGFLPKVSSSAGAIGLMQIMPATGKKLAEQEMLEDFEVSDLRDPEVNVRLGTAYIRDLKKDFDDNLMLVLCNYNAGPRPTRRWWSKFGTQPVEIFVEEIGYSETRDYVKKVMGNYRTYELIYSEPLGP